MALKEDAEPLTFGETVRIEDLHPADAIAIFGLPVYEFWLRTKDDPMPRGTVTVTGIDRENRTLTFDVDR